MLPVELAQLPMKLLAFGALVAVEKYSTVIASESCFARGVDHCLVADEDHLIGVANRPFFRLVACRKQYRAWIDAIDLIAYTALCYLNIL